MGGENASTVLGSSIFVTGSTADQHRSRPDVRAVGTVHLMAHSNCSQIPADGFTIAAMLWLPPTAVMRKYELMYERISNSPFIVRGGENSIAIPRFARPLSDSQVMGISYYGDPPNVAYRTWQRRGLLRMGHWDFGERHDLLSINMLDAIQGDLADDGSILSWVSEVIANITYEARKSGLPIIIIFPRHVVTDILVKLMREQIGGTLPTTLPMQSIRKSATSPAMYSPVACERLADNMRTRFSRRGGIVVILDTAIITGRTLRELTQLVQGLWELQRAGTNRHRAELKVRTVVLLDRTGFPTQRELVAPYVLNNPRLWRWDVPPLGQHGGCPLCGILDRCRGLRAFLNNRELASRVDQWITAWHAVPATERHVGQGLQPVAIPQPDSTRFCAELPTEAGPVDPHEVQHFISTSRSSIAVEICRSTPRKDYPLSKAQSGVFKTGAPIDFQTKNEILSSHLLLFYRELTFLDRVTRLKALLDLLWREYDAGAATALAALTALVEPDAARLLWQKCCALIEQDGVPNNDALIAAFCLYHLSGQTFFPTNRQNSGHCCRC